MLSSATLRAAPGEVRVLFGRNGSGKSTLLRIAAGLLHPDSGAVHFGGGGGDVAGSAALLGIADTLTRRPPQLSGGERRRAELAAVLVRRPTCLLADEPFRGITPRDAEELGRVFVRLAEQGMAVVISGHDVPALLDAAHHVSWCTSGTTYELGPPATAVRHDAFRRDYLGTWSTPWPA